MVFLDTEFTDLQFPALLSLAMVSIDGSEIYAELDLVQDPIGRQRLRASSKFTRTTVVPQFDRILGSKCSALDLGNRAGKWLIDLAANAGGQITIAFNYRGDIVLVQDAMSEAGIWNEVWRLVVPKDIAKITDCAQGELAAEASWLETSQFRGLDRHHALADALALKAAWLAVSGS